MGDESGGGVGGGVVGGLKETPCGIQYPAITRMYEAAGVEPVTVARALDDLLTRIVRVERSCNSLEHRAFPERLIYSPSEGTRSLADRIRDGWSHGYHLTGLTVGTDPDPIWDSNPAGSLAKRALVTAHGKTDECASRLTYLIDEIKKSGSLAMVDLVFHLNDIAVTLGDESAACAKAAREAR